MAFKITSPLTISGNNSKALLDEYNTYKVANPNTTITYQDYILMKEANGGLNKSLSGLKTSDITMPITSTSDAGVVAPVVNASGVVTPATDTNPYLNAYNQDLATLEQNKKYLKGNTIAQTLLNVSNLSNAFGKRPSKVGISNQPLLQYPDVTGGMTADLNNTIGQYRSGIQRLAAEKGIGNDVKIGAEANVLNADLAGKADIAAASNTNKIAEQTANAAIIKSNIENQYAANIADTTRNDANVAERAKLFSLGLSNLGKIGSGYAEGMIGLNDARNTLGANYDALKANYAVAVQAGYDKGFDAYVAEIEAVNGGGDAYSYNPSNVSMGIANFISEAKKVIK